MACRSISIIVFVADLLAAVPLHLSQLRAVEPLPFRISTFFKRCK